MYICMYFSFLLVPTSVGNYKILGDRILRLYYIIGKNEKVTFADLTVIPGTVTYTLHDFGHIT